MTNYRKQSRALANYERNVTDGQSPPEWEGPEIVNCPRCGEVFDVESLLHDRDGKTKCPGCYWVIEVDHA